MHTDPHTIRSRVTLSPRAPRPSPPRDGAPLAPGWCQSLTSTHRETPTSRTRPPPTRNPVNGAVIWTVTSCWCGRWAALVSFWSMYNRMDGLSERWWGTRYSSRAIGDGAARAARARPVGYAETAAADSPVAAGSTGRSSCPSHLEVARPTNSAVESVPKAHAVKLAAAAGMQAAYRGGFARAGADGTRSSTGWVCEVAWA